MTEVRSIRKRQGVAGNIAYEVVVGDKDDPSVVTFHGSVYGGPVVMELNANQTFVTDPSRFGEFGEEWVRRFFES